MTYIDIKYDQDLRALETRPHFIAKSLIVFERIQGKTDSVRHTSSRQSACTDLRDDF